MSNTNPNFNAPFDAVLGRTMGCCVSLDGGEVAQAAGGPPGVAAASI